VLAPFAIRTFVSCGIQPWYLPFTKPREAMLTFLLSFSLLRDFVSFNVELPWPYLASPRNRELLYSPGPQHSCHPSPPWHVVRSGGSTSLLTTSSGPTTLACLFDSLARGTHSCVHVQSKHGIRWSDPLLRSTTQIFLAFQSFREFAYRDSHTPVRFKRDLNPTHTLQIRRSRGSTFPPEQILRF
jgi:hypothetical protein